MSADRYKVDEYKQELADITASDDFKAHTLNRLQLAMENPALLEESAPPKRRLPKQWRQGLALASFALVAVVCWQVGGAFLSTANSIPVAEPEPRTAYLPQSEPQPESAPVSGVLPSSSMPEEERRPSNYFANNSSELTTTSQPPAEEAPAKESEASQPPAHSSSLPKLELPEYSAESVPPPQPEAALEEPADETPPGETPTTPPADLLVGYDIDPPASEDEAQPPEELPVYQSPVAQGVPAYSDDELTEIVTEQAGALGLAVASLGSTASAPVTADCGDATINAFADGSVNVHFASPVATDAADADNVDSDALVTEYAELLAGMEHPVVETMASVYGRGHVQRSVNIYDGGSDEGTAFSRSLSGARLLLDDDGNITDIHLWRADSFEKLGDYPLITEAEATALLADGGGFTSLPFDFPGEGSIEAVTLEYLYTGSESYVLPYYKFYVGLQLSDSCQLLQDEDAPAVSGIWYVPAIQGEYLD